MRTTVGGDGFVVRFCLEVDGKLPRCASFVRVIRWIPMILWEPICAEKRSENGGLWHLFLIMVDAVTNMIEAVERRPAR